MPIHSLAVVHPSAQIADDVSIGPFSVIGARVKIGAGTTIANNVSIYGNTTIGPRSQIYPYACLGTAPQDLKFTGEETSLEIGEENVIREFVTMNVGTLQDNGVTRIGSRNLFMIGVHVGHDCIIEDNCVLSNATALAGHVYIQRNAVLSGHVGVHQFTTIGAYVHVAALTRISQDAVPYMRIEGIPGKVRGVNDVGLKRSKFSDSVIKEIREAYRTIYLRENTTSQAIDMLDGPGVIPEVTNIINFMRSSARGTSGRARESLRRSH